MKFLIKLIVAFFPLSLKIFVYKKFFGAKIGKSVKIGFSVIDVHCLELADGSSIGHLNMLKGLDKLALGKSSKIGNLNWISGFPKNRTDFFQLDLDRVPELIIGAESSITNRHLIDCTGGVYMGDFVTFAGFRSQILTHSINIYESRQRATSVKFGDYCFVGTGVIVLPGAAVPKRSVIGAGSVVSNALEGENCLFAGSPARYIKDVGKDAIYFNRKTGRVN